MLPLQGHHNFCLGAVKALAEGYPPADLLMNRSICWLGGRESCRVWDNFAQLQLLDTKMVEKIPASHVADAFHLSQRESECKNTALFVEVLTSACLHGGTWCPGVRLSQAPLHVPASLGAPHNFFTGSHQCSPDGLLALVLMPVIEKMKPQLPPQCHACAGNGKGNVLGDGCQRKGSAAGGSRQGIHTAMQGSCRLQSPPRFTSLEPRHCHFPWQPAVPESLSGCRLAWGGTWALQTPSDTLSPCFLTVQHWPQCSSSSTTNSCSPWAPG